MHKVWSRLGWMVAGVLALFVISTLANVVGAGSLDPPGSPASTMLRLSELPPSWHQLLPSTDGAVDGCDSTRFACVMGGDAVLDRETGLVWERNVAPDGTFWSAALIACETSSLGGRYGWRLPTLHEVRSLVDTSPDHLPDGHPFAGAQTASADVFWTSSFIHDQDTGGVTSFTLNLDDPDEWALNPEAEELRRWCVRGGAQWDRRFE